MRSKYKNLIIIGNGFDLWQGLPTSYEKFRQYYADHVDQTVAELGFSKYESPTADGSVSNITAVEILYGDPFHPQKLPNEFFWNFEAMLDKIDDQMLNSYFGRTDEGLSALQNLVDEAQLILRTLFSEWITSLNIDTQNPTFHFPDNCFFINFNYTDTLEKHFGISPENIYYIHGNASDIDSIIVGHASHPETALRELAEQKMITLTDPSKKSPRLKGLYAVEDALYKTDKHVEDNIDTFCAELWKRGVHIEDFEKIYVLGHSFGEADLEYFEFLVEATRYGCNYDMLAARNRIDESFFHIDETLSLLGEETDGIFALLYHNIQYASHHRDRAFPDAPSLYPELDQMDRENWIFYDESAAIYAVHQRFLLEQALRTQTFLKELAVSAGLQEVPEECYSVLKLADILDGGHDKRQKNAVWYISYFSLEDKKRIQDIMNFFDPKKYTLYPSIDKCIKNIK